MGTFLPYPITTTTPRDSLVTSSTSTFRAPGLTPTGSTRSTSSADYADDDDSDDVWDLVDTMYARRNGDDPDNKPWSRSLIAELDGGTFGAVYSVDPSTNRAPLHFPRPPGDELDIPHFPALTEAVMGSPGKKRSAQRTSEPISKGIRNETAQEASGHLSKERFQSLIESQVGMLRFREWVDTEGYSGSKALFRYYQDAGAHVSLLAEVSAVTEVMQGIYFGPDAPSSSWAQHLLATRPSDCLCALESASLGMRTAQQEAFDKLYSAEFKRFVAGKLSAHAKFCLEHMKDWHDRGDLGEVFCLADPNLPDQPLVMVSDGFCRLTEYPRETLIGRNCRFLQGPATDPEAVTLLRQAIQEGREHCSMLINYTRTGKAFWNLFNMIPLRNPQGGIDYFLGAQVDCSRALTTPATFQALTGIAEGDRDQPAIGLQNKFAFSPELVEGTDNLPSHPELLRKIVPARTDGGVDGTSFKTPRFIRADGNRHYRNRSEAPKVPSPPVKDYPQDPIPIPQEVPNPVRDHMSAFSSAYSKLLVFDASNRRVMYVTAPLLAFMGYPVRTVKERLSPKILHADVLDLVTGATASEAKSHKWIIKQVVDDRASHSLFAGLTSAHSNSQSKQLSSISEETTGMENGHGREDDGDFVRSLLHLTPVKDINGTAIHYVVVVG